MDTSISSQTTQQNKTNLPSDENQKIVAKCVLALLGTLKNKFVVHSIELIRVLHPLQRKDYLTIIDEASKILDAMGFALIEIERHMKKCIVVSKIRSQINAKYFKNHEKTFDNNLLYLILGFIFMRDGTISQVELLNVLQQLNGFSKILGGTETIQALLKVFAKQCYVIYEAIPTTEIFSQSQKDGPFQLRWGARAKHEINKLKMLDFFCKVCHVDPKFFPLQYAEAIRQNKDDGEVEKDEE